MYLAKRLYSFRRHGATRRPRQGPPSVELLMRLESITAYRFLRAPHFVSKDEPRPARREWHERPMASGFWKEIKARTKAVGHYFGYAAYFDLVR